MVSYLIGVVVQPDKLAVHVKLVDTDVASGRS